MAQIQAVEYRQIVLDSVFEAAANCNELVLATIEEIETYLALAIQFLAVILVPQLIVIDGGVAQTGDLVLGPRHLSLEYESTLSSVFGSLFFFERVQLAGLDRDTDILEATRS